MRLLRSIIFFFLGLLVVLLLIGLFTEKHYEVERTIVIEKPVAFVFDYVKYLKNQDNYSKWMRIDPKTKKSFSGTDGTIGFIAKWDSENPNVGKGEQEIVAMTEDKQIDYELRFLSPYESTSPAYIRTKKKDTTSTEVVWGFTGEISYPINIMLLFFDMEKMVGNDLEEGLQNLKEILEK